MNKNNFRKYGWYFVAVITIAIWALLMWDFTHKGVPSHHLLANEDYPAISNWWGGIAVPLLTYLLVYRISSRLRDTKEENVQEEWRNIRNGFFIALIFAVVLSIFFTLNLSDMPLYLLLLLLITSLFTRIYAAECILGFVLGMVYTFGGVLPLLVSGVFSILGFLLYNVIRPITLYVIKKVTV